MTDDASGDSGPDGPEERAERVSAPSPGALRRPTATPPRRSPTRLDARDGLVRLHLPLVEHCARRFRNRGEPLEDLVQVGTIGLIKSIDRFDLERGVEFSTYATPDHHRRDQALLPRQGLGDPGPAAAPGAADADQQRPPPSSPRSSAARPRRASWPRRSAARWRRSSRGSSPSNAYSTLSLDAADDTGDEGGVSMLEMMGLDDAELEHIEIRESIKPLLEALPAARSGSCCCASSGTRPSRRSRPRSASARCTSPGCSPAPSTSSARRSRRPAELARSSWGRSGERVDAGRMQQPDEDDDRDDGQRDRDPGRVAAAEAPGQAQDITWATTIGLRGHARAAHHEPRAGDQHPGEQDEEQPPWSRPSPPGRRGCRPPRATAYAEQQQPLHDHQLGCDDERRRAARSRGRRASPTAYGAAWTAGAGGWTRGRPVRDGP